MLKTYDNVTRFMDGVSVNLGANFMYVKDISGKERIGSSHFTHKSNTPLLVLNDIITGKRLEFEGYHFQPHSGNHRVYSWFPSIQEGGIIYDSFDNDIQRYSMMLEAFRGLLFGEFLQEVASQQGFPIGEEAQNRLKRDLKDPSAMYAYSVELLYAGLNGNRDVRLLLHQPPSIKGTYVSFLNGDNVTLNGSLEGFLDSNPELKGHLVDGKIGEHGTQYNTPEAIMERLKKDIPQELLEIGYQQFRREFIAKDRLQKIRDDNPIEKLEEQVKGVDNKGHRISLAFPLEDLQLLNK